MCRDSSARETPQNSLLWAQIGPFCRIMCQFLENENLPCKASDPPPCFLSCYGTFSESNWTEVGGRRGLDCAGNAGIINTSAGRGFRSRLQRPKDRLAALEKTRLLRLMGVLGGSPGSARRPSAHGPVKTVASPPPLWSSPQESSTRAQNNPALHKSMAAVTHRPQEIKATHENSGT